MGRRLRVFDGLLDMLERVLADTRSTWQAGAILSLFDEHAPTRLQHLIPDLIQHDPSWITIAAVRNYLHRRRQDLLTPFLGQRAYMGRFSTGKTRYVLPFATGFQHWTASQQTTFAQTLAQVAGDDERDTPTVLSSIAQLAAMPAIEPMRLIDLAGDQRPAVQDAALRALGRLDAGQGIPTLLAALNDERARITIYALRGAVLEMPPARALVLLRSVPVQRMTVFKEVLTTPRAKATGILEDQQEQRDDLE